MSLSLNLVFLSEFIRTKESVLKRATSVNSLPCEDDEDNSLPPARKGQHERLNRSLHDLLHYLPPERKRKWPGYISDLVFSYNMTPHASTRYSPYFLMYGRDPYLPIDFLLERNPSIPNDSATTGGSNYIPKS